MGLEYHLFQGSRSLFVDTTMTSTIQSFDTFYPADSIEFCPSPQYSQYFVCGTYKLEEQKVDPTPVKLPDTGHEEGEDLIVEAIPKTQSRVGRLFVMYSKDSGLL
jgi:diphthamide biosynthesis protein 7